MAILEPYSSSPVVHLPDWQLLRKANGISGKIKAFSVGAPKTDKVGLLLLSIFLFFLFSVLN
ncbi:hypothetical protein [Phormidium sp. CCY1219]|uniref:hypothetical protein n=1 Tax=Phormidium sp. CCY1219 TaxID=2886104 RepID=UPI002D1F14F5|nr:hypothetical protein [Phormidium sp. CCY1219]MEB3831805.1 hypothetical protein [Phormidium sp. CCY1219]